MEIHYLPYEGFRIAILRKFNELQYNTFQQNQETIHKQNKKFIIEREMEKNQTENLELKNSMINNMVLA